MRQSTVIFASIVFAFIVYITMRGQLPAYIDLFKPNKSAPSSGQVNNSQGGASGSSITIPINSVVSKAKNLIGGLI